MTRKEFLKPALIAATLILSMIFCFWQACDNIRELPITSKEQIIAEYQKQMLKEKHDTLTIHEYIYLDKWHDAKVITKHTIDSIYLTAPDTCDPYIKKIENAFLLEQKAAQMVRTNDSTDIRTLLGIVIQDSVLIHKANQDLKLTQDTLTDLRKPKPLKKFINNTKHVVGGVLTGAAIVETYNFLK